MNHSLKIILIVLFPLFVNAQQSYVDSLHGVLITTKEESQKVNTQSRLSEYYSLLYPDSALWYAEKMIAFSIKKKNDYAKALGLINKAEALDRIAEYPLALEAALESLEVAKRMSSHRSFMMGRSYALLGHLYSITGSPKRSVPYLHAAASLLEKSGENPKYLYFTYFQLAYAMLVYGNVDSALFYIKKGSNYFEPLNKLRSPAPWLITGNVYMYGVENIDSAEHYFREGIKLSDKYNTMFITTILDISLAKILYKKNNLDSSLYYTHKSLQIAQKYKYRLFEIDASGFLSLIYDSNNVDSAYKYLKINLAANNAAFSGDRVQQFQKAASDAEKREKDLKDAKLKSRNQFITILLLMGITFFGLIALLFWRNIRQKKKATILLTLQKEKVENTLVELKATQSQLIQSEKMASLGELTAGIAHEIQNPLNFVNNFSEVSNELIDEMNVELDKGDISEAKLISSDIKQNLEKINHHGKRAADIIKGMLQHSRTSSGQKEPTDINALADEYLRLAYHGLRAKDKTFNANMKTDFDESIGNINIIPQDIGRVILNLITNAFYVVNEKSKQNITGYEPTVELSTKKAKDKVEVKVKDNGAGIPQKALDKIFQPFFTTKPTGQGTGLGLSLSYDIVKAHGGELRVETKEGEGSEFIVKLPIV